MNRTDVQFKQRRKTAVKTEAKIKKREQRFGLSVKPAGVGRGGPGVGRGWAGRRARAGGEKSGGTVGKRQRGSKLSNK